MSKQVIVVKRPKVTSRSLRSFRNKLSGVYQKSQNVSEQNCNASWSKVLFQLVPSSSSVLLYVHRLYGPLGTGSPGHPPQLSHSSWAPTDSKTHVLYLQYSCSSKPDQTGCYGLTYFPEQPHKATGCQQDLTWMCGSSWQTWTPCLQSRFLCRTCSQSETHPSK